MAITLRSRKVPKENIKVTGLPVFGEFAKSNSKALAKKNAGLPQDKKVALVIAGAKEPGPYKNIRKTLNESFKYLASMDWIHFVICVGDDPTYATKLMKKAQKYKANNITIFTYTNKLHKLMEASDIAIIKPGGLATTECLCAKLPMLLLGKTYAQENINRRYLLACGVAEHVTTYKGLVNVLCDIFTDEGRYKNMVNNISKVRKPNAAKNIVKFSTELLNSEIDKSKRKTSLYIGKSPVHTR